MRWFTHSLFVTALLVSSGIHAQQPDPIPTGPMAPTRDAFLKVVQAEELRTAAEYAEHTNDPRELRERAKEFLTAGMKAATGLPVEWSREKFHEVGSKLIEDGSTDPLVIALTLQTQPDFEDYKRIAAECQKAIKDVVEVYEPRQQVLVIQWCQGTELALSQALWQMRRQKRTKYKHERSSYELLYDAHVRWIEAEADSLDRQRYIWHIMTEFYLNPQAFHGHGLVAVAEKSRENKVHPWMRRMLDAQAKYRAGRKLWLKRDEGYRPHYDDACKEYLAAWKIAPQFPEAATELLQLSRDGHVEGTPREWFDRVVLAEIDHPMAYTYYRTHLRSEGADALIAFGEECAASKRYDTKVPFELLECLWAVENHTGENVWARDGIYEKVRDLCQSALQAPKYMGAEHNEQSRAWLNGTQLVLAARANRLEEVPPLWDKTDAATLQRLAQIYRLNTPLPSLKAAAMAAASEPTRLVNVVEGSLAAANNEESLQQAAQQIETAAAQLKPDDPRVAQWRATLAVYKDFYAGKWAKVTFPADYPKLAGADKWTREDEQTLVARGCQELSLEGLARLPMPLELSMDISTLEMPEGVPLAGVQIGPRRPIPNQHGKGSYFGLNGKTRQAGVYHYALGKYNTPPLKETNELRVRVWHGYSELFVNGERMTAQFEFDFRPTGYVALWVPGPAEGKPHVRFANVRVRPLDFGPPPGRKAPLERVKYFTARLADEPDNHLYRLDRADANFAAGKLQEAAEDYDQLLKTHKKWQHVILQKGLVHAAAGEHEKAIEQYKKLLDMPSVEVTHVASVKLDNSGKRIENTVNVPYFHMRALDRWAWLEATSADAEVRNGASAVERARQAVKMSQNQYRECYLTLAAAYAEAGDFAAAQKAMQSVGKLTGSGSQALIEPIQESIDQQRAYHETAR